MMSRGVGGKVCWECGKFKSYTGFKKYSHAKSKTTGYSRRCLKCLERSPARPVEKCDRPELHSEADMELERIQKIQCRELLERLGLTRKDVGRILGKNGLPGTVQKAASEAAARKD